VESDKSLPKPVFFGVRLVLIASLILFLLATLGEVYNSPADPDIEPAPTEISADDNLIVPGVRVGPITLGLKTDVLSDIFGKPKLRPHKGGIMHLFEERGLVVYAEQDRVMSVTVRTPEFQTRGGVAVGSDVDEVLNNLGKQYEMEGEGTEYILHNWSQGWHTGVKEHKVTFIQVTPTLEPEK